MPHISLFPSGFALVDPDDYEWLSQWKWRTYDHGYAVRAIKVNRKTKTFFMHREILGARKGLLTDHINGNKLDNRKENLRICTHQQNQRNKPSRCGASKYKGVSIHGPTGKFQVHIRADIGKRLNLGHFDDEEKAAKAYDMAALKYHGEFANLNFGGANCR